MKVELLAPGGLYEVILKQLSGPERMRFIRGEVRSKSVRKKSSEEQMI